jgi:hypothetical protein
MAATRDVDGTRLQRDYPRFRRAWCLLPGRAGGDYWNVARAIYRGGTKPSSIAVVQEILALMAEIRTAEALEARRFAGMARGRGPRRRYARF